MSKPPYERIVQWAAGPVAALVGWLSVQITNHVGLLGSVGFSQPQILKAQHYIHGALASASNVQTVGQSQIGYAIFSGLVFVAATFVTFAAHHKWLSNLPLWWAHATGIAYLGLTAAPDGSPGTASTMSGIRAMRPADDSISDNTEAASPKRPDPPPAEQPTQAIPAPTPTPEPPAAQSGDATAEKLRQQLTAAGLTPTA